MLSLAAICGTAAVLLLTAVLLRPGNLVLWALLAALAVASVGMWARARELAMERSVRLGDAGLEISSPTAMFWLPWDELRALRVRPGPRLEVRTETAVAPENVITELAPPEWPAGTLREAFLGLAPEFVTRGLVVDDEVGWGL